MKKQITLCIAILLAVAMLLCACGSKTEAPTTSVNIPAVSIAESTQSSESYPSGNQAENAAASYPAETANSVSSSSTYPIASGTQMSDAEIEALLEQKLGGHHTLEWVLSFDKTYEEWDQLLSDHHGVTFTPEEKDQVIKYLMSH